MRSSFPALLSGMRHTPLRGYAHGIQIGNIRLNEIYRRGEGEGEFGVASEGVLRYRRFELVEAAHSTPRLSSPAVTGAILRYSVLSHFDSFSAVFSS